METSYGLIATNIVVNAAGPWAQEVGNWGAINIPLTNKVRTIVMTGPLPEIPADRPFVEDETVEWYFRPETDGVLMGMGNVPAKSPETQLDNEMVNQIVDYAIHRVPVLEKASLLTAWSGVRPLTADGRPIFGAAPGLQGFLLNTGWGGVGIIQAPVAGQLMAELIQDGYTSTFESKELGSGTIFVNASGALSGGIQESANSHFICNRTIFVVKSYYTRQRRPNDNDRKT